jgi:hypothetical protein
LGIVFSKTGRKIDPDKVKSIELFPEPTVGAVALARAAALAR